MSTAFATSWITDPSTAAGASRAAAETLNAFADGSAGAAEAADLARLPEVAVEALVELLTARQDGSRLALLQGVALPKGPRKAVGRAIQSLKARGIACEAPVGRVGGLKYTVEVPVSHIGLPLPNGMGFYLLADMVQGRPEGGLVMSNSDGCVHDVAHLDPTKSRFRKVMTHISDTASGDGYPMMFAEAPHDLLRWRIHQAIAQSRAKGLPIPGDGGALELLFGPQPGNNFEHPVHALLGGTDPGLADLGARLLGHAHAGGHYHSGIVDVFPPTEEWVDQQRARLDAMAKLGDGDSDDERFEAELDAITEEGFDAERRGHLVERLLDSAYVLHHNGGADVAAIAYATAQAMRDGTRRSASIPWCKEAVLIWIFPEDHEHEH